jgi:nucleoside-diphosphate-sugar epimerase
MQLGMIGLGWMGANMVRRLIKNGHQCVAFDRSAETVNELEKEYLYKYPQAAFPYADLVDTNRCRSRLEFEYELMDTAVFDPNWYFDVRTDGAVAGPRQTVLVGDGLRR